MCQFSPYNFSSNHLYGQLVVCLYIKEISHHAMIYFLLNILVVFPVSVAILFLGLQQRKGLAKISHSDAFTFHVSAIQIISILSSLICVIGIEFCDDSLVITGIYMFYFSSPTLLTFQCLTCGERYIAVVHPLTYLRLKKQILARNIVCGLVWVYGFSQGLSANFMTATVQDFLVVYVGLSLVLAYILFCNISVLVVLLRPRPGDGARKNQSTKRAFYTISAIFGTLVLKSVGDITGSAAIVSGIDDADVRCGIWSSVGWFSLPCNVILQILYLHRTGKLPCC